MPRLSLYKEEKGHDYSFIDRQMSEMFQVGGTECYFHKYLGPRQPEVGTPTTPLYDILSVSNIQDLLFLENRDRNYSSDIYKIRGFYNVQNIDFNLSQFGIFIENDTIYLVVHINDIIKLIGRKPIVGDVLELPHLRDEFALNEIDFSLPRYYMVEDVGRASEGFSATWYPHLYRLKMKKMSSGQEYSDILNKPIGEDAELFAGDYQEGSFYYPGQIVKFNGKLYQVKDDGTISSSGTGLSPPDSAAWNEYLGSVLNDVISVKDTSLQINDILLEQAEVDSAMSGFQTRQFWTLAVDQCTGQPIIEENVTHTNKNVPVRSGYQGYLVGDGFPDNGYPFGFGVKLPSNPENNDFYLRVDFQPNRLFRYNKDRWIKQEDNVRMTLTNSVHRQTHRLGFINNTKFSYFEEVGFDIMLLQQDQTELFTNIDVVEAKYLVLLHNLITMEYVIDDSIVTEYNVNGTAKIKITLPDPIKHTGRWNIRLCNSREEQRQSIYTATKPKADL